MTPHIAASASVIASGGAITGSRYLAQLRADVLGTSIQECIEPEATGRGTAILALHSLRV